MKTVAAYVRVSHPDQNPASQREELKRWLKSSGIDPAAVRWYEDTFTGRSMDRPQFNKLQAAVAAGEVKTVVVYKLDRLSRTMADGFALIRDWCKLGVRLVSTTQQVDLSGVIGQMIAAVIMGISEIEWEYRRERQAVGIAAAKANGVKFGRPKGEGGRPGKRIKVTPEQVQVIRELRSQRPKRCSSVAAIARATGLSRPTIYSVLGEAG